MSFPLFPRINSTQRDFDGTWAPLQITVTVPEANLGLTPYISCNSQGYHQIHGERCKMKNTRDSLPSLPEAFQSTAACFSWQMFFQRVVFPTPAKKKSKTRQKQSHFDWLQSQTSSLIDLIGVVGFLPKFGPQTPGDGDVVAEQVEEASITTFATAAKPPASRCRVRLTHGMSARCSGASSPRDPAAQNPQGKGMKFN